MTKDEVIKYLCNVLNKSQYSITTDWLAYCIEKKYDFEIIKNETISTVVPLTSGIPAVGTVSLVDNDFFDIQNDNWKKEFSELCRKDFTVCINETKNIEFSDKQNVKILSNRLIVSFKDFN